MANPLRHFWWILFAGCNSDPSPNAGEVELPPAPYTAQIPNQQALLNLGEPTLLPTAEPGVSEAKMSFTLDNRYPMDDSVLIIHDLWSSAEVWLNQKHIGNVTGGSFPAELELGQKLRPGNHELRLKVKSPGKKSGFLLGARKEINYLQADIGFIQLRLRPQHNIDWIAFPFDGSKIQPTASINDAPEGATVSFLVTRDGKKLADLGEAQLKDGRAVAAETPWELLQWGPDTGSDALYQFGAILKNAQGEQLDALFERDGARSTGLEDQSFLLNKTPTRFVAVRMESNWEKDPQAFEELLSAGINTIEIHGSYPYQDWLKIADETGLFVVMLPRCDGEVKAGRRQVDTHAAAVSAQHKLLYKHTLHNPSLLFWTTEGSPDLMYALAGLFQDDPLERMVTGRALQALSLSSRNSAALQKLSKSTWITEITTRPGEGPQTSIILFERALKAGAIGGVLPVNRNNTALRKTWYERLQKLDVPEATTFKKTPKRGNSFVWISQITDSAPLWLEAPFTTPTGVLANTQRYASIEVFHAGEATLRQNSQIVPIVLQPSSRIGTRQTPNAQRIQWTTP